MIPPPPRSTLFPYTTLFRSFPRSCQFKSLLCNLLIKFNIVFPYKMVSFHSCRIRCFSVTICIFACKLFPSHHTFTDMNPTIVDDLCLHYFMSIRFRSEEHTSELQSRPHLVCRLLLEKKKIKIIYN